MRSQLYRMNLKPSCVQRNALLWAGQAFRPMRSISLHPSWVDHLKIQKLSPRSRAGPIEAATDIDTSRCSKGRENPQKNHCLSLFVCVGIGLSWCVMVSQHMRHNHASSTWRYLEKQNIAKHAASARDGDSWSTYFSKGSAHCHGQVVSSCIKLIQIV